MPAHATLFDDCPAKIVDAAIEVSTSWGPSLSDQLAISLQVTSENVCAVREASKDGKCVIAGRGIDFAIEAGGVSLTRAQVLSLDHDQHFVVGTTKGSRDGFAIFADKYRTYPPRRSSRSWGSPASLVREMQGTFYGEFFPISALENGEQIVMAKAAFNTAIQFPDPRVDVRARFDNVFNVFMLTDRGRILSNTVRLSRDPAGTPIFERDEDTEQVSEKRNYTMIETLGGKMLLALSDEGALYFIEGDHVQKISAVPGQALAMTGYAARADYLDSAIGSDPRWIVRVWVAARASEGGRAELYELKKPGHALEKTPYQPESDRSIVSLSADVKADRVPLGPVFLPAQDYFAHPYDIDPTKVRAGDHVFEEKLVVGAIHHGTPLSGIDKPYSLLGLTRGGQLQEMEFKPQFRHRAKPKKAKPAVMGGNQIPAELLNVNHFSQFPRDSMPNVEPYYRYLTQKAGIEFEFSGPIPAVFSLERRRMVLYQALKRRLMILYVYTDPVRGLRLSPMNAGLSLNASILLTEVATLPPVHTMRFYRPLSAAELHPHFEDWIALFKTPLRHLYAESKAPDTRESKVGVIGGATRVTTSLAQREAWNTIVTRLQLLYEEDAQVLSRVLIQLLSKYYTETPLMALGDALAKALKEFDPLREFNSLEDIQRAQSAD